MKLIYMEITHNTDDSARDLSSVDEGEEWDSDFFPHCISQPLLLESFCMFASGSYPQMFQVMYVSLVNTPVSGCVCAHACAYVCDGEHVCELLSLCWPCRDPACLSGSHWSIMLSDCPEKTHYSETTQHINSELQVSLFCFVLILHYPGMQMSCLQCPSSQIA